MASCRQQQALMAALTKCVEPSPTGSQLVSPGEAAALLAAVAGDSVAQERWRPACTAIAKELSEVVMRCNGAAKWAEYQVPSLALQVAEASESEQLADQADESSAAVARQTRLGKLPRQQGLRLADGRYFMKGDSGWCRNGNAQVQTYSIAIQSQYMYCTFVTTTSDKCGRW